MKGIHESALMAGAKMAGAKFMRPETGFVHYFYHGRSGQNHATIPVYENLNWALAHFQTRTQEGVQEGRRLLEKLLPFQNASGEFPVYLHEFPQASDHFLGCYLFFPLYWIGKDFGSVLGGPLKDKLHQCLNHLVKALKERYEEKKPKGHIVLKLGAILYVMEQDDSLLKQAATEMHSLSMPSPSMHSSGHIADLELVRSLGVPNLPAWPELFWHSKLQTYIGPAFKEFQEGLEPEVTLLDLMMAGFSRQAQPSPHHIAAALVKGTPLTDDTIVRGVKKGENWGYSALEMIDDNPLYHQPGFHLFRYLTEGEGKIDSLSIPASKIKKATFVEKENGLAFQFDLDPVFEPENKDKQREIELYINLGPRISTSVFRLNETITLDFANTTLNLTFRLISGSGDFVGHISRGNRPSQIIKGEAFDQVLSLRTLRRSPDARLELAIDRL